MAEATGLERAHLTIRGVRAELVLEDGRFTLRKDGPPATSRTFAVDQVRGTVIEAGSRGGRGWIHLAVVGGTLAPPGELAAMSDPYTLPVSSRSAVTARRLARLVEKHLRERGLPSEPAFAATAPTNGRYSSGVTLTRAPGTAPPVVEPMGRDEGPPHVPTPGSTPRVTVDPLRTVDAPTPGPGEDVVPDVLETVAAEAAIDQRAASTSGSDVAAAGSDVGGAGSEGAGAGSDVASGSERGSEAGAGPGDPIRSAPVDGAANGWVKPSGPYPSAGGAGGAGTGVGDRSSAGAETAERTGVPSLPASSPPPTEPPPVGRPSGEPPVGSAPDGPPPSSPPRGRGLVAELRQLGELHASGVLTDAEFEQAKARVLG